MPNKKYETGRRFEYAVKKKLEEHGWTVIRAAGSHGWADLVAWKPASPTYIIQCKSYAVQPHELKAYEEQVSLFDIQDPCTKRVYMVIERPKRGVWKVWYLGRYGTWQQTDFDDAF